MSDGSGSPLIRVENLRVSYGPRMALDKMNLHVSRGEFVAVVGASGCGKSTLLRVLAGLLIQTAGNVLIDSHPPADARRSRIRMAYVFQDPVLLEWRTVRDNILLATELSKRSCMEMKDSSRLDRVTSLVRLTECLNCYPRELSGGMRMRVSLARALMNDPELLLLDEPFAALDAITRRTMNDELMALAQKHSSTVIFATHDIDEAVRLSDRIIVMANSPGRDADNISVPMTGADAECRQCADLIRDKLKSLQGRQ